MNHLSCILAPRSRQLLRMFSAFPDGWPGVGLLILRAAAGAAFLIQGSAYLVGPTSERFLTSAIAFAMLASGASLLIGYLTPFGAVLAGLTTLGVAFSWFPAPNFNVFEARPAAFLATVIVAALVCLGPGAFSIDARRFGRREIIIPENSTSSSS